MPLALAVGWELMHDDKVVVVHEIKHVEVEGSKVEVVVVKNPDGSTEEIEIHREDTAENTAAQEGSVLVEGDASTLHTEAEEEVDVEE